MEDKVITIFTESQKTSAVHQKNATILKGLYGTVSYIFIKLENCIYVYESF